MYFLEVLKGLKICSFSELLNFGKRKKSHREKYGE
jgi:hypothetical protein